LLRSSSSLLSQHKLIQRASYTTNNKYDVVVIGGGHNGLVAANYLLRHNPKLKVAIFEKRYKVGGAAVSENCMLQDFTYSRASYLCALLRPQIIDDFKLRDRVTFLPRNPSSFTPMSDNSDYLLLGSDAEFNRQQISKFSTRDAKRYEEYDAYLSKFAIFLEQLLDQVPIDVNALEGIVTGGSVFERLYNLRQWMKSSDGHNAKQLATGLMDMGIHNIPEFFRLMTSPASKILDEWFESDILKATLSTDSVIGEYVAPSTPGSAYVLLHHVMGDVGFGRGIWAYVKGGMGSITQALKDIALEQGAYIECNSTVTEILTESGGTRVTGVKLEDGREIKADIVVSNCNAYTTFVDLLKDRTVQSEELATSVKNLDFSSATFKINLAVDKLPNFKVMNRQVTPESPLQPGPEHRGTIHFEDNMEQIEKSYLESKLYGKPSERPLIEMTIPSALDDSIAPPGKHVVQMFVQYAPYELKNGDSWTQEETKRKFAESVYKVVEHYAPGFRDSIIPGSEDLLSPYDLEQIFSLRGGNIFHGSIKLGQLYFMRPAIGNSQYKTPVKGLFLCGSSAHPGGGVMGAPGRNAASVIIDTMKK
jgi:phytoene dehydrogenase-like protein